MRVLRGTPRLTPWFGRNQKPVRAGYYETDMYGLGLVGLRFWDGKEWRLGKDAGPSDMGGHAKDRWRGVLK